MKDVLIELAFALFIPIYFAGYMAFVLVGYAIVGGALGVIAGQLAFGVVIGTALWRAFRR